MKLTWGKVFIAMAALLLLIVSGIWQATTGELPFHHKYQAGDSDSAYQ